MARFAYGRSCAACMLISFSLLFLFRQGYAAAQVTVSRIVLSGSVNPASAQYFSRALAAAHADGSAALLVELDTPGGLVSSLRLMVQDVLASKIPVIVYVSPSGAQAASAGALLMLSAHVAAMSPGTEIGAAHPVGMGGGDREGDVMSGKAASDLAAFARSLAEVRGRNPEWAEQAVLRSRASSAREALRIGVIDLIAAKPAIVLRSVDGLKVRTAGGEVTLATADASLKPIAATFQEQVLMRIADPNIAYILFLAGLAGLYFELASPGAIFPGVAGAVSLLLGLYAMQMLPVSITGVLLLLLGVLFLGFELFVTSGGVLAIAGLIALFAGSLMLFDTPGSGTELSLFVFLPVFLVFAVAAGAIVRVVLRSSSSRQLSGQEGLLGEKGRVVRRIEGASAGKIFVHGELWDAVAGEKLPEGTPVKVTGIKGLQLQVTKTEE
ncbi:NfeD family protein [Chlorobium sp.]|uniref:NfeD family protein n=1 Tax=Chlorobium sp. TaxID=1095 RepID=UPI003C5A7299